MWIENEYVCDSCFEKIIDLMKKLKLIDEDKLETFYELVKL